MYLKLPLRYPVPRLLKVVCVMHESCVWLMQGLTGRLIPRTSDKRGPPFTAGSLVLECSCVLSLVLQSMQGQRVVDQVRLWSWLTICLDWVRLLVARSLATGEHTLARSCPTRCYPTECCRMRCCRMRYRLVLMGEVYKGYGSRGV